MLCLGHDASIGLWHNASAQVCAVLDYAAAARVNAVELLGGLELLALAVPCSTYGVKYLATCPTTSAITVVIQISHRQCKPLDSKPSTSAARYRQQHTKCNPVTSKPIFCTTAATAAEEGLWVRHSRGALQLHRLFLSFR